MIGRWLVVCAAVLMGCGVEDGTEIDDVTEVDDDNDDDKAPQGTRFDPNAPTAICKADDPVYEELSEIQVCAQPTPDRYRQSIDTLLEAGVTCTSRDRRTGRCIAVDEAEAEDVMERGFVGCWWDGPRCANGTFCVRKCCAILPPAIPACTSETIFQPF